MFQVLLYTKENCLLCNEAEQLLFIFEGSYSFQIVKRDIYTDDQLLEKYHLEIPVIEVNGKQIANEAINLESIESLLKYGEKKLS